EGDLDLLPGLGRARPARALVGDPVLVAQAANAKGLVGQGEIASRVAEVGVLLIGHTGGSRTYFKQTPHQVVVVNGALVDFDFKAHGLQPKSWVPVGQRARRKPTWGGVIPPNIRPGRRIHVKYGGLNDPHEPDDQVKCKRRKLRTGCADSSGPLAFVQRRS